MTSRFSTSSTTVLPWFDTMMRGSLLGADMQRQRRHMIGRGTRTAGKSQSLDGMIRVEWEIVEWSGDSDGDGPEASSPTAISSSKRKLAQVEEKSAGAGPDDVVMDE